MERIAPSTRRTIAWVFVSSFVLAALGLGALVLVIHGRAAQAVRDTLGHGLAAQSGAVADALQQALARQVDAADLSAILRRVRDAGRLDTVTAIDRDGRIIAAADPGSPPGTQADAFVADPLRLEQVLASGRSDDERLTLLGEPFHRLYLPVSSAGKPWGVLVLEAHDPTAGGLSTLHWPLWTGLAVAVLGALALAGGLSYALRLIAAAQARSLRNDQLAAAGTLAATVAHEVRNPLQLILAATQTLERHASERDRTLLATIAEEVRRADDQLDAFLDVARDTPLRHEPCDLRHIVQRSASLLEARSRQAGAQLVIELPDTALPVSADPRKLGQALINLLLNAIQAIEPTGRPGRITVQASCQAQHAELLISDDGPGIPAALQSSVFDPFVSARPDGMGLGLPQARRTVARHNGILALVSSSPAGTVFRLTLPLVETPCAS